MSFEILRFDVLQTPQAEELCKYHPHFREVDETLLCEVGRSFLDKCQIRQVHAQIGHTRRVTAAN